MIAACGIGASVDHVLVAGTNLYSESSVSPVLNEYPPAM
jgi:hypothetical protein